MKTVYDMCNYHLSAEKRQYFGIAFPLFQVDHPGLVKFKISKKDFERLLQVVRINPYVILATEARDQEAMLRIEKLMSYYDTDHGKDCYCIEGAPASPVQMLAELDPVNEY